MPSTNKLPVAVTYLLSRAAHDPGSRGLFVVKGDKERCTMLHDIADFCAQLDADWNIDFQTGTIEFENKSMIRVIAPRSMHGLRADWIELDDDVWLNQDEENSFKRIKTND